MSDKSGSYVKVKESRKKRNKSRLSGYILNFCCCYVCIIGKQKQVEEDEIEE